MPTKQQLSHIRFLRISTLPPYASMGINLQHRPPPIMIPQQLDILYVGIIGVMVTTPGSAPKAASISQKTV